MTTKEYLNQISKIDNLIKNRRIEIDKFKEMAQSISVSSDKERVQTSGISDIVGNNVVAYVMEEEQLEKDEMRLLKKRREIINKIEKLEKTQYNILFLKFVDMRTIDEISYDMKMSSRQVKRLYIKAMENFEELFLDDYKNLNVVYNWH